MEAWGPDWLTEGRGMAFQNYLNLDVLHVSVLGNQCRAHVPVMLRSSSCPAPLWWDATLFLGLGRTRAIVSGLATRSVHGELAWAPNMSGKGGQQPEAEEPLAGTFVTSHAAPRRK